METARSRSIEMSASVYRRAHDRAGDDEPTRLGPCDCACAARGGTPVPEAGGEATESEHAPGAPAQRRVGRRWACSHRVQASGQAKQSSNGRRRAGGSPRLGTRALRRLRADARSREARGASRLRVSVMTLRNWMVEAGLWTPRRHRDLRVHQPRSRRECREELVQIDGCELDWFEERGPRWVLLVFVDDATSELMELRFARSESTFEYFTSVARERWNGTRPPAAGSLRPVRARCRRGAADRASSRRPRRSPKRPRRRARCPPCARGCRSPRC